MRRECKHTKATYDPRHKETYCKSCNKKICNSCSIIVHDDCTYCFPCCKTHDYMPQVEFEEKGICYCQMCGKREVIKIMRCNCPNCSFDEHEFCEFCHKEMSN